MCNQGHDWLIPGIEGAIPSSFHFQKAGMEGIAPSMPGPAKKHFVETVKRIA